MSERGQEIAENLLRLSAQKLWAERANPVSMPIGTWIACFQTEDHLTWRSTDGVWQAQLERSTNGNHISLAVFCREGYAGSFDHRGWHAPSARRRNHRPRPIVRSRQLPLAS
ncbi:MAG: hypothetical protein JO057_05190 [Chloroflexi bacterium]|nr:hypothetical protein [Chloroflexota bacterium]